MPRVSSSVMPQHVISTVVLVQKPIRRGIRLERGACSPTLPEGRRYVQYSSCWLRVLYSAYDMVGHVSLRDTVKAVYVGFFSPPPKRLLRCPPRPEALASSLVFPSSSGLLSGSISGLHAFISGGWSRAVAACTSKLPRLATWPLRLRATVSAGLQYVQWLVFCFCGPWVVRHEHVNLRGVRGQRLQLFYAKIPHQPRFSDCVPRVSFRRGTPLCRGAKTQGRCRPSLPLDSPTRICVVDHPEQGPSERW